MADRSRERNYVDAFSDYGLDERQTAIQNKIMTKCFKILYYGVAILTVIWLTVPILTEMKIQIPTAYIAASYFVLAMVCSAIYAVQASKHGAINGITAFSWESKGQIVLSLFVVLPIVTRMLSQENRQLDEYAITIIALGVISIVYNVILHYCGKRNFKVLDEAADDTDENEEE